MSHPINGKKDRQYVVVCLLMNYPIKGNKGQTVCAGLLVDEPTQKMGRRTHNKWWLGNYHKKYARREGKHDCGGALYRLRMISGDCRESYHGGDYI
jgi:hypothetical protein